MLVGKSLPVLCGIVLAGLTVFYLNPPWSLSSIRPCEIASNPSYHINQQLPSNHLGEIKKPAMISDIEDDANTSHTYYDDKYWAWQKKMNMFGGTFKGDLIAASMSGDPQRPMTILEFGSSGGFIIEFMREHTPNSTVVGVEINAAAREHCRRHFPKVEVVARTASIPASSVDFIYTTSVLEHVECPVCELRELRRVMKPNGEILVMVISEGVSRNQDKYIPNDVNNHLYTWTALQMGNTINAAGLHVCGCSTEWSAWAHISLPSYMASKRETCMKFQAEGRRLNSLHIRCMAVLPDDKGKCSDMQQRLHRTLECRYLK
jgi:ubiquinone/menaquinone biosynthesis C-methylase UbiE